MEHTGFDSVEVVLSEAKKHFFDSFKDNPNIIVSAPGRVNLIGEHTDYNEGFVFPMAIPMVTVIVGKVTSLNKIRIRTLSEVTDPVKYVEFSNTIDDLKPCDHSWANYVLGVIVCKFSAEERKAIPSFDIVIASSVPLGGGLSSSASLEVAVFTFLEALDGQIVAQNTKEKALVCQKAEHTYASVPCGIMDQFISVMGQKDHALLIDCQSMEGELVHMNNPDVIFLITNSNVKHKLTGSEYPLRRNQCFEAAKIMNKVSLRMASMNDLLSNEKNMSSTVFKRARHVISENERCQKAVHALKTNDMLLFGKLMNESHQSLKDDFEVSCPEVDELVQLATNIEGVHGSRMTGGGFGGCTVTLLNRDVIAIVKDKISSNYSGAASFYVCTASDGAQIMICDID